MVKNLVRLVNQTAHGQDDLGAGVIGYGGYGFVFRNLNPNGKQEPYVFTVGSSKVSAFDIRGEMSFLSNISESKTLEEMISEEDLRAPIYGGKIKTLLPTLKFGGYEKLFSSWLFVKTPQKHIFPAKFYYGPSGLAIGGWKVEAYEEDDRFYPEFLDIINFSPFTMEYEELEALCDALKNALDKVPATDYYAQYGHDVGTSLMGVKRGKPFIYEIGRRRTKIFLQNFYTDIDYDPALD